MSYDHNYIREGEYYHNSYDYSTSHRLKNAFWITKQTVIKKLGRKEDEHVVASDSELDAKLELFRSVQKTCNDLIRVIDRYQERICSISQAENEMGRFLKNHSDQDKTQAGKMMAAVGKSLSFSAQQRLALRVPLSRLQAEVETFRNRAVSDTLQTLQRMEASRTEYRGSLLWMKSSSEELDPDTFKQMDKFRRIQAQVKRTKQAFDRYKLDSMQKIDLLAASRCNLFSHVLALYQESLTVFWEKAARTMQAVADGFKGYQYYEFSMLKSLTQESRKLADISTNQKVAEVDELKVADIDLLTESSDCDLLSELTNERQEEYNRQDERINNLNRQLEEIFSSSNDTCDDGKREDLPAAFQLLGESSQQASDSSTLIFHDCDPINLEEEESAFHREWSSVFDQCSGGIDSSALDQRVDEDLQIDWFGSVKDIKPSEPANIPDQSPSTVPSKTKTQKSKWIDMFADLDPLADPDHIGIHEGQITET